MSVIASPQISHPIISPGNTSAAADALRTAGYCLIPGVIDQNHCERLQTAMDAIPEDTDLDVWQVRNHLTSNLFNRHSAFLPVLDLPAVADVADTVLGGDCHVVTQKGWRAYPGHSMSAVHVDHLQAEMPEDLCMDARYEPPIAIISALLYLVDVGAELCPTHVVCGSHRSGRAPRADERTWRGNVLTPILAKAGDVALFRSDLWHSGGEHRDASRTRYVIETAYGRRMVAQKFYPYLDFRLEPTIAAAASARQLRLLGRHERSNYG